LNALAAGRRYSWLPYYSMNAGGHAELGGVIGGHNEYVRECDRGYKQIPR
jgi:hypothetical protein